MKTFIALLLLSSTAVACDDQMEQQTQIMQQQLFSQQRQAQEQIRQERFNTFSTNMILLDGQDRR